MQRIHIIWGMLIVSFVFFTSFKKDTPTPTINWMTWEEVQKATEEEPKKIFVDVYTDWCGWCKKMDAGAFSHPDIVEYVNENYYAVKFNAENKETISFKGEDYKFVAQGMRGYNELAATLLNGKMSYPTTVYLDEELNLITAVPGYQTPQTLDQILVFFGDDYFKKIPWEEFQKSYSSDIK